MSLRVTKWYLDLCTDAGEVVIVYAARIRWRRLRLNYSATLEMRADGSVAERMTLRSFQEPCREGDAYRWAQPRLGVDAIWRPLRERSPMESQAQTLLETEAGQVSWSLLSGRSEVEWRGERKLRGLGYVEKLELTLPPWDLPIDELRWGRFVAQDEDAAWIEWRGPHPLRLTWKNGASAEASPFLVGEAPGQYDPESAPEALGLSLSRPRLLRDGPLVSTVFAKVPLLRRSLPMRMLTATETKWCSAGVTAEGARGWAIHEVVRWGR